MAAELGHGTRYDRLVEALGCHGELVERPDELPRALERAFAAGRPALVNVLTDPGIVVQHGRWWTGSRSSELRRRLERHE